MTRALALVALAAIACAKRSAPEPAPAPAPTPTPTPEPAPTPAPRFPPLPATSPGEAHRSTLPTLESEPALRPHLTTLRAHFGTPARGPFRAQRVDRSDGGAAWLVARADESDSIVIAVDRDRLLFSREHPVAGMTPPVTGLTIAPGPERGVALFGWVATQHLVAARMWADDGNPFAEIVAFTPARCDDLAEAYAPGWGWILACRADEETRAQLLRDDLTAAWAPEGLQVGAIGPASRPAIGFEPPSTWTLTQKVKAVGGDRTVTFRYGAAGTAR